MPSKSLSKLYLNIKKTSSKAWSFKQIQYFKVKVLSILIKYPQLIHDPLKSLIDEELASQASKLLFKLLPFDFSNFNNVPTIMSSIKPPALFDDKQSFESWIDSLELYFSIVEVKDDAKKKNLLLYLLGEVNSKKLKNYLAHLEFDKQNYSELVNQGKKLWQGADIRHASNEFFNVVQVSGQTVHDYALKVQELATQAHLVADPKIIINKFISGLKSKKIKYELLKDEGLQVTGRNL